MHKKGFAAIIPILVIALIVTTGFVGISSISDNSQKKAVGRVLSEKSEAEKQADESQKKATELQSESQKKTTEEQQKSSDNKSSASTSNSSQNGTKVEIEKENNKLKVKTKNEQTGFESESETEAGKEKTKIKFEGIKIEVEQEGSKIVTKFKDENGKEVDLEATEEAEVIDNLDKKLEEDDVKISTNSAELGFTQKGRRVRTNFPLSVNPATGELFVTTPSGTKTVTVLPQQAIENMIEAGVMTRTEEPQSPPPLESSGAAQVISGDNSSIELTEVNNQPTYAINGIKSKKILGLIPVDLKIQTYVSATDGSLLNIKQDFLTRILSLISF